MLAGDVMVEFDFESRDLQLTGDFRDNSVQVFSDYCRNCGASESGGDGFTIEGLDGTNLVVDGETVESYTFRFESIRDLNADFGGGDDYVQLAGISVDRSVNIDLRSGRDTVDVYDAHIGNHLRVRAGGGHDTVNVEYAHVYGNTIINGSAGRDDVSISGFYTYGVLMFNGSSGSDTFDGDEIRLDGGLLHVDGANGNDEIVANVEYGDVMLIGGKGDDSMTLDYAHVESAYIWGNEGADHVELCDTYAYGEVEIDLGQNEALQDESVMIYSSYFENDVTIRGAEGSQTVGIEDSNFYGSREQFGDSTSLTVALGGGRDSIVLRESHFDFEVNVRLLTGSGADQVMIGSSTYFDGDFMAELGGGRDEFTADIDAYFDYFARVDGGNNNRDTANLPLDMLADLQLLAIERMNFS